MMTRPAFSQKPELVGRQRELSLLWQRFEEAVDGHMNVALVSGEPGIGKTRLLDEIASRAEAAQACVLRGTATEAEGMPPYLPFLEALGAYIRSANSDALRSQTGDTAPILATLLPELRSRLGDLPANYPLPPEQARLRLYEAINGLLAAVASERPLLLLLDDLHWADPATFDLLCYIAAHASESHLMILGAHREGETSHPPAFERMLATLQRLRLLTTVALARLTEGDVAQLARSQLRGPLEPSGSRLLSRQSEGNPFFVEELLRSWIETGMLRQVGDASAPTDAWQISASRDVEAPSSILTAVRQRLIRLSPEIVDLLRIAAIIGRTFSVALLAEMSASELETVEERLLVAARAQLIRPGCAGTFNFAHDKIRECLYGEVTAARRTRLHALIGQTLEALPDSTDPRRIADLAFHFTRSGDRERGVRYARQAAEAALAAYAFEEAMAHYRDALDLLDGGDERRGPLLLALGEVAITAGSEREATGVLSLARSALHAAGNLADAARASHALGRAAWRLEDLATAQDAFEATLALLGDAPTPAHVGVLVDLGTLLGVTVHRFDDGLAYGRRALAMAEQFHDNRLIAPAARTVGNMLVRGNDLEAGIPLLEKGLALAERANDPAEAAECCACLVLAYLWWGDFDRMLAVNERQIAFARQCHDLHRMRHAHTMSAMFAIYEGQRQEADKILADAEQIIVRLADPEPLGFLRFVQGASAYHRGDYAMAEEYVETACRIFRALGPGALVWFLGLLALVYACRGKSREAREAIAELELLIAPLDPASIPNMEAIIPVAQAVIVLSDSHLAERFYAQLLPFRRRQGDFSPERLLGELAILRRDWATADDHLAAAEAFLRQEDGAPKRARTPELGRTLAARARLELAWHGRAAQASARELLQQSLELMGRVGMDGEAAAVREQLDALSAIMRDNAESTRQPFPDHLTRREVEVLRLIAAGASNQSIAEALVLSVRTVERHISNIYAKIGAEGSASRATATAYAIRHELL